MGDTLSLLKKAAYASIMKFSDPNFLFQNLANDIKDVTLFLSINLERQYIGKQNILTYFGNKNKTTTCEYIPHEEPAEGWAKYLEKHSSPNKINLVFIFSCARKPYAKGDISFLEQPAIQNNTIVILLQNPWLFLKLRHTQLSIILAYDIYSSQLFDALSEVVYGLATCSGTLPFILPSITYVPKY